MMPGEPPRTVAHFRQRVKEAKVMLEMLELHLEYAGYRDASKRVYDARLRLSEVGPSLPESDE